MASDIFAKIGDIKGESLDDKHKDEIEVMSFSWGASNANSFNSRGGGASAGKVAMQDFHIVMKVSKASPLLMLACAKGEHIPTATITHRMAAGRDSAVDYLKVTFSDVLVSSYQHAGTNGDSGPLDQVSLAFAKVEVSYRPQKADGTLDAAVVAGWDLKANKSV